MSTPPSRHPTDARVVSAAHDVVDHLNAIVPLGWTSAVLRLGPVGDGLGINKISTQGTPDDSPRRKAVAFDPGRRAVLLGDTLAFIRDTLRERGVVWDGLTVHLTASDEEGIAVRLTTIAGQGLATLRVVDPTRDLLVTPELDAFVAHHLDGWLAAEAALQGRVGESPAFVWDSEKGRLAVGDGAAALRCEAELIGVFESQRSQFTWAWSRTVLPDLPAGPPGRARALAQDEELPTGLNLWRFPFFHCEEALARTAARMTAQLAACLPVLAVSAPENPGVRLYFGLLDSDRYLRTEH